MTPGKTALGVRSGIPVDYTGWWNMRIKPSRITSQRMLLDTGLLPEPMLLIS